MSMLWDQWATRIMDGSDRSVAASAIRLAASICEPAYATVMRGRNALYDSHGIASHPLGRPTISVGNITMGGTGKTPVVAWLARQLISEGKKPAILMRGYRSDSSAQSDEKRLLQSILPGVCVIADPNRIRGGARAMAEAPNTDVFLLDDGMQHRRVRRDFELVLINARQPFGFGHVFPRGMLREPLGGLRRASAFLITHSSEVSAQSVAEIETTLRTHSAVPIFHADHVVESLAGPEGSVQNSILAERPFFAFCGIGSPDSFFQWLRQSPNRCVGATALDDHHRYDPDDLQKLQRAATSAGAQVLVTTEKDWAKLADLAGKCDLPIYRTGLQLAFRPQEDEALMQLIRAAI